MLRNYIKMSWRSVKANPLFSMLNIFGLALGLAVSVVLFLFISNELDFDSQQVQKSNIYRVLMHAQFDGVQQIMCLSPNAVAPALQSDIPEIKYAARLLRHGFGSTAFVRADNNNFAEKSLYWCDPELFRIFNVSFISGNAKSALVQPNTIVLSKTIAEKYFGSTGNAIGKTILVDNKKQLQVTGVYQDFPANSTLDCDMMASFQSSGFFGDISWSNPSFETYCLLANHSNITQVEKKIQDEINRKVEKQDQYYTLSLQPLSQVHLYSAGYLNTYSSRVGDIKEVNNLLLLTALILVIACINYMNLSTARSQKRAKFVGINKTLGATFRQMIIRFYAETGMITLLAISLGLVLAVFAIPLFTYMTGKALNVSGLGRIQFLSILFLIWALITLVAGLYPALYLSGFSPKTVLQQAFRKGIGSSFIRKGLVVLQFTSSIILIIGVMVIHFQLNYMRNKNLGYQPENVLAISTNAAEDLQQVNALVEGFKLQAKVLSVCRAQGFPGMRVSGKSLYKQAGDKSGFDIQSNQSESGIVDVLKLKLLAGNDLPKGKKEEDTLAEVVLNKNAIDRLGYTSQEAIGKKVAIDNIHSVIVGVVSDFNFASLHDPVAPYAFSDGSRERKSYLLVRFNTSSLAQTMTDFEGIFKQALPHSEFDYQFLDKYLETLYSSEQRMSKISIIFSILAVVVACLGLFGLAAFTAEQRSKEIGIRKVLGATPLQLAGLLSRDFVKLVILSIGIGSPLAGFFMNRWLQDFAYRVNVSWWIFALAAVISLFIALLTVSFQAVKAALANPVNSLKMD